MTTPPVSIELATRSPLPPSEVDLASASSFVHGTNLSEVETTRSPTSASANASQSINSSLSRSSSVDAFTREQQDRNFSSLAPVDGGRQAWSFLAGSFLIETLVLGLPNAFGVFLNSYLQDSKFSSQPHAQTILPLVGTISSGIMYCSGLILFPLIARYPKSRKPMMWIGVLLAWLGLFAASFATKISQLLVFQGIMYGIGGSLIYSPVTSYLMEWFVRRRGFASGLVNAGTAVGGLTLPPILPKLIGKYGRPKTLRYLSFAFAMIVLLMPVMKPRLPEAKTHAPRPRTTHVSLEGNNREHETASERSAPTQARPASSWTTNVPFQLVVVASAVQALAYFVPVLYLPSFASLLGLDTSDASLTVALLNGGSLLSRVTIGMLSDRLSPFALATLCALGTSLVTFLLWGVVAVRIASHFAGLLAFGLAYGALAGGWTSLMVGFVRPVSLDDPRLATNLIGLLCAVQGIGNILSTPIAASLFRSASKMSSARVADAAASLQGGGYEKMIIYVGSCFAGAGVLAGMGLLVDKSPSARRPW